MSDLTALLSASSYPVPEPLIPQPPESDELSPFYGGYGGLFLEDASSERQTHRATAPDLSRPLTQKVRKTQGNESASMTVLPRKRRGRPQKTGVDLMDERPEERRRLQIRLAQRAYRSRKEATLSRYEARIAQLEAAMKKMSSAVLSFDEHVAYTDGLASNSDLQSHLHDTVEICKSLAEEADLTSEGETTLSITSPSGELSSSLPTEQQDISPSLLHMQPAFPASNLSPNMIPTLRGFPMPLSPGSPLLFDTTTIMIVELSQFIRQLRMACIYHAYLSLRNPSLKLDDLQRKFRFLLSLLNRERLASYFEAALNARVHPAGMAEWEDIPFFSVGGAGTHYPRSSSPNSSVSDGSPRYENQNPVRENPLSESSPEIQNQMNGEWFDIRDLEGYLQENRVYLLTHPPAEPRPSLLKQAAINASSLIKILVGTCICLGRSPGWRRPDVERALSLAVWT